MTSAVQTVFNLFAIMSLLAKLAFAAELGYRAYPKWLREIRKIKCKACIVMSWRHINKVTKFPMRRKILSVNIKL